MTENNEITAQWEDVVNVDGKFYRVEIKSFKTPHKSIKTGSTTLQGNYYAYFKIHDKAGELKSVLYRDKLTQADMEEFMSEDNRKNYTSYIRLLLKRNEHEIN